MKMGEIRINPSTGGFEMMTPNNVRSVTLRCSYRGEVMVEEVAGGGVIMPMHDSIARGTAIRIQGGALHTEGGDTSDRVEKILNSPPHVSITTHIAPSVAATTAADLQKLAAKAWGGR